MTDLPDTPLRRLAWPLLTFLLLFPLIGCAQPQTPPRTANQEAAVPVPGPATALAAPRRPAKVMGFEGASWLERPGREEAEKPDIVLAAMDLRPGLHVAEIGAGTGWFARRIAPHVAPGGTVYGEDIQPEMLELMKKYAAEAGVTNVEPVLGTDTDPKLPAGKIDRVLLVDVYHEFQKPQEMLARIRQSLAPGGRVILVEYRLEGDTATHIHIEHRMSVEQVLAEWTPAGFELVNRLETLPSQHLFIFTSRRGARPVP
jgi:ubiquinone/menaquinone biosynthesis C-methylase UbiE